MAQPEIWWGGLFDYSVSPGPFLDLDLDLELDKILKKYLRHPYKHHISYNESFKKFAGGGVGWWWSV